MIRIGIGARDWCGRDDARGAQREAALVMHSALQHALRASGALPLLLPAFDAAAISAYLQLCDGLVLQGGRDIAPSLHGARPWAEVDAGDAEHDLAELALLRAFLAVGKPVLGFCRGFQLINIAFGGALYQDIPREVANAAQHSDPARYVACGHDVSLVEGGYLHGLYGVARGWVNSAHHQGVARLGAGLKVEATCAADGLIEAVRGNAAGYVVGVQWHPEFLFDAANGVLSGATLFADFVTAAHAGAHEG
jgi:putative glutamine amidotransferase